jgi:hypothetical protein
MLTGDPLLSPIRCDVGPTTRPCCARQRMRSPSSGDLDGRAAGVTFQRAAPSYVRDDHTT